MKFNKNNYFIAKKNNKEINKADDVIMTLLKSGLAIKFTWRLVDSLGARSHHLPRDYCDIRW